MKGWPKFLYALSVLSIIIGFIVMYHYGDYNEDYNSDGSMFGHTVGGDAYNYIIMGLRGLGFMAAGLISAVIATGLLIMTRSSNMEIAPKGVLNDINNAPLREENY